MSVITIYSLKQSDAKNSQSKFQLEIECLAEIRIHELLPHPTCIISIQLAQLNYYPGEKLNLYFCLDYSKIKIFLIIFFKSLI